ncbi:MAG: DMT family transporter [Alphaproteobacteria bacterium]|jgi:drug/metabolite transporter (DMT)-like permease|nr:DMT family transporter [Thalassospira sp.]MCE2964391.1 DMT family transporter [Alphaproteobacteria bacterium]
MTAASVPSPLRLWGCVVLLSLLWAIAFPLTALTLVALEPLALVAWRLTIAGLCLCLYQHFFCKQPFLLQHWRVYLWLGVLGNVLPFLLIGWGLKSVPSGVAALIIGTVPLFTVLIAHLQFPNERLTWRLAAGISLGFIGVASLFWPLPAVPLPLLPVLAIAAAALCYGLTITELKRFNSIPFVPRTTGMMVSSAITSWVIIAAYPPTIIVTTDALAWLHLLLLALLPSASALLLTTYLLHHGSVTHIGFSNYLTPIFGVVISALVLGERITGGLLVALVFVIGGMVLTLRKR